MIINKLIKGQGIDYVTKNLEKITHNGRTEVPFK
jgi:hypothetical protein